MRKESTESRSESRPEWEQLEDWVRSQVQRLIQELLEEEVTEFLGRAKSALRSDSDSDTGYRNGYGRARRLTLSSGTIQLRRPRVRDTEEQFESRLLPLFVNRTRKVAELIPELYLHGLSEGDFDLALRGLLGEDAPVSASTVARLKDKWNDELAQWRSRPLDDLEVVYMWVDGVYVKAGLEKEKAAVLVVMAALSDGSKVVVRAVPGYRESTENWSEVLRDIKRRGLSCPRLVVGDGHLGIWGALRNVYPQAAEQRCWNHKIVNVLAKLPKRQQDQAKLMLRTIPYAPTRTEAERLRTVFTRWCGDHSYEAASEALERDWDRMVTFYDFPKEHWGHLRTTNPVESPFAALRLRTDAAKRYKRVDRAIAVIWKMLMVAEQRFRRLKAPELIEDVYLGAQYAVHSMRMESPLNQRLRRSPPDVVYTPIDVTSVAARTHVGVFTRGAYLNDPERKGEGALKRHIANLAPLLRRKDSEDPSLTSPCQRSQFAQTTTPRQPRIISHVSPRTPCQSIKTDCDATGQPINKQRGQRFAGPVWLSEWSGGLDCHASIS